MTDLSSILAFAELVVKHVVYAKGRDAVFRPSNFMSVNAELISLIQELSARGYLSKTRNSKGVRIRIHPDSPLYRYVVQACAGSTSVNCAKQVAEYLYRFL